MALSLGGGGSNTNTDFTQCLSRGDNALCTKDGGQNAYFLGISWYKGKWSQKSAFYSFGKYYLPLHSFILEIYKK